jgi:hypothetical protein
MQSAKRKGKMEIYKIMALGASVLKFDFCLSLWPSCPLCLCGKKIFEVKPWNTVAVKYGQALFS